jgi:hypothetical protein
MPRLKKNIPQLCVNTARRTPAVACENRRRKSFLSRCTDRVDMMRILAALPHLLIGSLAFIDRVGVRGRAIASRSRLVEGVPSIDPKINQLLSGRDPLYADLREAVFRAAFARHFELVREKATANGPTVYLFEKA